MRRIRRVRRGLAGLVRLIAWVPQLASVGGQWATELLFDLADLIEGV